MKIDLNLSELTISNLTAELNLKTEAGKIALIYKLKETILLDKKQQDYGSKNISSFGTFGVLVRLNDKLERLKHIFGKGRQRAIRGEKVQDTFQDTANYGTIGQMLEDKKWPSE